MNYRHFSIFPIVCCISKRAGSQNLSTFWVTIFDHLTRWRVPASSLKSSFKSVILRWRPFWVSRLGHTIFWRIWPHSKSTNKWCFCTFEFQYILPVLFSNKEPSGGKREGVTVLPDEAFCTYFFFELVRHICLHFHLQSYLSPKCAKECKQFGVSCSILAIFVASQSVLEWATLVKES